MGWNPSDITFTIFLISPFMESVFKLIMLIDGSSCTNECLTQLNNRNVFSHSSETEKFKSKVQRGLVSFESSLPGLHTATFCCVLTWSFFSVCGKKDPTLMISVNLNYLLKALSPNTVILGVKTSTHEFGAGDTISPQQRGTVFCTQNIYLSDTLLETAVV